jgi:hypothetical protein
VGRSKGTDGLKDQNSQSGSGRIDRNTFPLRNDPYFSRATNFAEQRTNHGWTAHGEYSSQNKSHRRRNIQKASNTILLGVLNWLCDVLGNLQAFLSNVLDAERAQIAFKFMWGVGVNDPYPVTNLYPPVQAGDPDWRPYYIVNLLSLPRHYQFEFFICVGRSPARSERTSSRLSP